MEKRKLTEICNPKQWKTIPTSELVEVGYPVYGANGIIGFYNEYNHEEKTIAITCRGATCGTVNLTCPKAYITGNAMCLDDVNNTVILEYLFYAMKAYDFSKVISGSAQPQITRQGIEKVEVVVYPPKKQQQIVCELQKVESLIALRQEQLAKLDELVKSRFVEMFGDVVHNNKSWNTYQFSDVTTSRLGKMLDAKQQTGKFPFPYLANANVQWFRFETGSLNQMDFNEADQEEFKLEDGDLLVCEGGEIGRCAVWHNEIQPCFFQKALHRVRCNQEIILPDYLAWWFKFNCDNNGFAAIEGAKATIAHLPGAKLKQLQVVTPPVELQTKFVAFVTQVDKSKLAVQQGLQELEILKKSLMQQYFG